MSEQAGQRDHSNTIQGEDDTAMNSVDLRCCYAGGHKDEKDVDGAVCQGVAYCLEGRAEEGCLGGWSCRAVFLVGW